jgi:cyclopropane-fatty-acyl-phospholipid synthase
MSFLHSSKSLLPLDRDYNSIRPHHLVIFYSMYSILKKSKFYQHIAKSIVSLLSKSTDILLPLVYSGLIPDGLIRLGIRLRLSDQLYILKQEGCESDHQSKMNIVTQLKTMPIAINTDEANDQHYEVPAAFYDLSLGPRKKYSSGLWTSSSTTFEESEIAMLELYCERAQLEDGMNIVDLGCGWGSLTLFLAEKYRNAKITGISNSHSQREYILRTAKERGLNVENINIVTCNVADDKGALDVVKDNDRVLSIEM